MAGAVALVHPSLAEGFGFTPLEAMSVGTPALVTEGSSPPDILGPAAVALPADDPDRWAEAIDRAVHDADWRADLSTRGRAWSEQFTWASTADRTAAVHEAVLAGGSGR
jgi:alpha-1,3-rhamnosyl/mannosyltransferase